MPAETCRVPCLEGLGVSSGPGARLVCAQILLGVTFPSSFLTRVETPEPVARLSLSFRFRGVLECPTLPFRAVQDVLLPYMLDPRHPRDTLFLVAEHDWRCYEHDDIPAAEWLPMTSGLTQAASEVIPSSSNEGLSWPEPVARHDDPPSGRGRGSGPGPAAKRGRFGGIELPRFPQKERFLCSPELAHLVAFCNEAARRDRGNVLWLSWNSNGAASKKAEEDKLPIRGIDFGSTLLAFTVDAARAVLDEARTAAPGHWDLWLLQVLCRATALGRGSAMAIPSFGNYGQRHRSLNVKGSRKSMWDKRWTAEGTVLEGSGGSRPGDLPRPRELAAIARGSRRGGDTVALTHLPPRTLSAFWRTQAPPTRYAAADPLLQRMLANRGWLDDLGRWLGPFLQTAPVTWVEPAWKGQMRGEGKDTFDILRRLPPEDYWRQLQEEPEGGDHDLLPGDAVHPTNLGLHLCVAPLESPEYPKHGSRREREVRAARHQYLKRWFIEDADFEQVARVRGLPMTVLAAQRFQKSNKKGASPNVNVFAQLDPFSEHAGTTLLS